MTRRGERHRTHAKDVIEKNTYTVSQKNVPPMVCNNFDTHEQILIFFSAEMLSIK